MKTDVFTVKGKLEIHPAALIMPPMSDEEFQAFKEDISGNGLLEPIILFQEKVLDGRNRYNACSEIGIDIHATNWEGGMDPIEYVVSKNIHRRQLTPSQRAMAAAKALSFYVDQAKERQRAAGGDRKSEQAKSVSPTWDQPIDTGKATEKAGRAFDVSRNTVNRAKTVLEKGTESEKKEIESGKATVSATEKVIKEREKAKPKKTFNRTNDSIEWAKWSWNPATGCLHGCEYCYARDFVNRYPESFPNGFKPSFYEDRMDVPQNTKLPERTDNGHRNVFVCSMADLFGAWVDSEWITKVIDACKNAPEWTFIFLTKNPERLTEFVFPENAWVGTTVDTQARVAPAVSAFKKVNATVKFLSCEPMIERLDFGDELSVFDWVIIGGWSDGTDKGRRVEFDWVFDLTNAAKNAGCKVYWKPNLNCRPMEYPK